MGAESNDAGVDEFSLNTENKPYNPFTLSGAMTVCSLLWPQLDPVQRISRYLAKLTEFGYLRIPLSNMWSLSVAVKFPSHLLK